MKTIANHKKCKIKWNNKNHEKNKKNKHEYCQSSRTNSAQWNENVRTQNYARNELTMITQLKNWLKTKKCYDEKLWMQDQTNSNKIMNESQKTNIWAVLKIWEIIHEIIRKSSIIRTQIMKSWNIIQKKSHVRKTVNISIIVRRITRVMKLFWQQFMKRIYMIFYQWDRIFSHLCAQEKQQTMIMYRLSET